MMDTHIHSHPLSHLHTHTHANRAPFHCNEAVTMWMPMTEILPEEEGGTGLTFATKSHRDFALNFWMDPHAGM